jgi:hypothetical protein
MSWSSGAEQTATRISTSAAGTTRSSTIGRETSTAGAPSGRYLHSAVWTGGLDGHLGRRGLPAGHFRQRGSIRSDRERVVSYLNDRRTVEPRGAPAVWTGREMLVWGGRRQHGLSEHRRPVRSSTDTWSSMSTVARTLGRYYASAVWTGSIDGGSGGVLGASNAHHNSGGVTIHPKISGHRHRSSMLLRPDGFTALCGRVTRWWSGEEMYNCPPVRPIPAVATTLPTDEWTPTSMNGAPPPRADHSAVWTGREMVVWGGSGGAYLDSGGRYDPSQDAWTATSTLGVALSADGPTRLSGPEARCSSGAAMKTPARSSS